MQNSGHYLIGQAAHAGRGLTLSQDRYGYYEPAAPELLVDRGAVFVLCDGQGELGLGASAAETALRACIENYYSSAGRYGPGEALADSIQAANEAVLERAPGGRSTLVAAVVQGMNLWIVHAGNSRAYLIRDGLAYRLTRDHFILTDQGEEPRALRGESPPSSPHLLGSAAQVAVDLGEPVSLQPGDAVVLCSDGLHSRVGDEQIAHIVSEVSPQEAAERLVALAYSRGGWDDISVLISRPLRDLVVAERALVTPQTRRAVLAVALLLVGSGALLAACPRLRAPSRPVGANIFTATPTLARSTATHAVIRRTPTRPATSSVTATPSATSSATGVPQVVLPDLAGRPVASARAQLAELGLSVREVTEANARVPRGVVIRSQPAAGTGVPVGSTVTLVVSSGLPAARPVTSTPQPTPTQVAPPPPPSPAPTNTPPPARPTEAPPVDTPTKPLPPTPEPTLPERAAAGALSDVSLPPSHPGGHVLVMARWKRGSGEVLADRSHAAREVPPEQRALEMLRLVARWISAVGRTAGVHSQPAYEADEPAPRLGLASAGAILPAQHRGFGAQITPTPTESPGLEQTATPTSTDTPHPTLSPTASRTRRVTRTPSPSASITPTASKTPTASASPTITPTFTPEPVYLPRTFQDDYFRCVPPWIRLVEEPEPNDRVQDAAGPLCRDVTYIGRVWTTPGDVEDVEDNYFFELSETRPVRISLVVPRQPTVDYDLFLYDWTGTQFRLIGASRHSAAVDEFLSTRPLPPRRYWLRIYSFQERSPDPYTLVWQYVP